LNEFFNPPQTDGSSVVDLRTPAQAPTGGQSVAEFTIHLGNATLKPETGETRTAGLVFTPFQGFVSSIDWWYIHIKEAINDGLAGIAIENFCLAGAASYCEDIVHTGPNGCTGPTLLSCGSQPIFGIISQAVNSDSEDTSGIDFLADYRTPFFDGALDLNTQDNYTFMLRYTTLGNTCDVMNSLSGDRSRYGGCNVGANPKFKGNTSATYSQGGWLGTVGLRVIGASHYINNWTSGVQIGNNDIPAFFYVDLRLSYNFGNGLQLYGAIDNVGDRILPIQKGLAPSVQFGPNVLDQIYDGYGRVWHLGLRMRFGG
jgi:outer membrane receptor protein involved in Fe transport